LKDKIKIYSIKDDESYIKVKSDTTKVIDKIKKHFSVLVNENWMWIQAAREKRWDGKIRFFKNGKLKKGLLNNLKILKLAII